MEIHAYNPKQTSPPVALKITTTDQPVESSVKSVPEPTGKADAKLDTAGVSTVAQAKKPDDLESDIQQAVSKLNDFVQARQSNLQFSVDKESGAMVVKVVDSKSEKVIRQIPAEETLKLTRFLMAQKDEVAFNIFSSKA
ncbi:MAG: flagellar protein FlaG [Methylobacter sp.]|nr:flagellar protein FlaG [Methylobacter sp.]